MNILRFSIIFLCVATLLGGSEKAGLPDETNPDYIYCEDFGSGQEKTYIRFPKLELGKTYHWRATAIGPMGRRTATPDTVVCGDTLAPQRSRPISVNVQASPEELSARPDGTDIAFLTMHCLFSLNNEDGETEGLHNGSIQNA